jgi:GT2 family glycosyltransferase
MQEVNISIIIVNYNVKELLLQCIKSIYTDTNKNLEIEVIVVDNNSKDGSVAAVAVKFPEVRIIANTFNAGFSGANNQGMQVANGKYFFLLNPDTEIIGDALLQLRNYMDNHNECAVVAPQLLNSDISIQTSVWKEHSAADLLIETFYVHKLFDLINYPLVQLKTTFEAKSLSGAALFFKKSLLLNKSSMLDDNLFWMEDIDFCYRAQQHGTIVYLHSAQVIHHSGQSQKKNYNIAISNQLISKLKYYKKHSSFISVLISYIACFIFIIDVFKGSL